VTYHPTTWQSGDIIVAAPLNKLEAGVADAHARIDQAATDTAALTGSLADQIESGDATAAQRLDALESRSFATVAATGSYSDLVGTPPPLPALAAVATSGAYTDLTGRPTLAPVAASGAYADLSGRPALATVATTGSYNDLTNLPNIAGSSGLAFPGVVQLDDFGGANDDAKLVNAMSYVAAQTQKPAIMLPPGRLVTFTQSQQMFSGLKIIGPPVVGWQNVELSSGALNPTRVRLNVGADASSWLVPPAGGGNLYNLGVRDLAFESTNAASQFIHYPVGTGTLYAANLHNLDFQAFKGVLGSAANPLSMTLCALTGNWNMTTARGRQVCVAGSDNVNMWCGGSLNVGPGGGGTNLGAGEYLVSLQTAKSNWGNVYITADDNWRALQLTGTDSFQVGNRLTGFVIEGRNTNDPSPGALVSCSGGGWLLDGFDLNYAMTSPSTYTDRTDRGYIHQTGGSLFLNGGTTDRATGVADSVPVVFVSGGESIVTRWKRCTKGGTWTQRPVVQQTTAGLVLNSDATVQVITSP
jgi:hypothetical protein